jgi:hypothetical protein
MQSEKSPCDRYARRPPLPAVFQYALCMLFLNFVLELAGSSRVANAAEPAWVDARHIGPFVCQSTFPLDEYERLLAELPELQRELTRILGVPAATQPIHIYLFADAAAHENFIAEHFPKIPYRRALFVKVGGRQGVYAYRQHELDIDLRHESTHAMLHAVLPDVPLWLDEGLAEYFEMPAGRRAFDHPHYEQLRWDMRVGRVRTLESLEERQELGDMANLDYRYAWAWVHFLLHGPEPAHHALVGYLAALRQGTSDGRFSTRLKSTIPDPAERLVRHFKHWSR